MRHTTEQTLLLERRKLLNKIARLEKSLQDNSREIALTRGRLEENGRLLQAATNARPQAPIHEVQSGDPMPEHWRYLPPEVQKVLCYRC